MSRNTWVGGIVVIILLGLGWWWYSSNPAPAGQSAAVGNVSGEPPAPPSSSATEAAITATVGNINAAVASKDAGKVAGLNAEFQTTVGAVAMLYNALKLAVDTTYTYDYDISKARAALSDIAAKLSLMQSSTLSMSNAEANVSSLNAVKTDLAAINTAFGTRIR